MSPLDALEKDDDKDADGGETDAAADILDAVRAKDATALSKALSRFYELCHAKHEEEEEAPESGEAERY